MEHSCEHCGAAVEDGTPFCPKCGEPQIRIVRDIPPPVPAGAPFEPGTPGDLQPPAVPVHLGYPRTDWRAARWSILGWGLAATVFWFFLTPALMPAPFVLLLVSVIIFAVAGGLAARSYASKTPGTLTRGIGARIGAVTGVVGLVIIEILSVAAVLAGGPLSNASPETRAAWDKQLQAAEPQVREFMTRIMEHPGQLVALLVVATFFYGLIFVGAGALGGAFRGRRQS